MSLFKKSNQKEVYAIFDIGSASVAGALIEVGGVEGKPKILHSVRKPMVFQEKLSFKRFVASMLKSLSEVSVELETKIPKTPDKVMCFLSSPWYASQTRFIEVKRETPFIVSEKLLEELMEKEIESFKKDELIKYPELKKSNPKIIESHNIRVRLNGYETSNPIGKKANEAKIAFYVSVSTERVINNISENIKRVFNVEDVEFNSFMVPFFSTMRDLFHDKHRFLLLDISGEITDIALVKNNVLFESVSFPLGTNFLIRRLVSGLKTTPLEATTALNLYIKGESTKAVSKKIKIILDSAKKEWLKVFQENLHHISKHSSLSSTIFLVANKNVAPWFIDTILKEEFHQYTLSERSFEVEFLSSEKFKDLSNFAHNKDKDPFLILEAIFANKTQKK